MIKDVNLSSVLYFSFMNGRDTGIFICPEHLQLVLKSPVLQYLKRRLIFLTIPVFSSRHISCQQAKHLQLECLFQYMFLTWLLVIDIEFSLIFAILENETQFLMSIAFNYWYVGKKVKNLQKMEKISNLHFFLGAISYQHEIINVKLKALDNSYITELTC